MSSLTAKGTANKPANGKKSEAAPSKNGHARIDPIDKLHQEAEAKKARLEIQKRRKLTRSEEKELLEQGMEKICQAKLIARVEKWERQNDLSDNPEDSASHWASRIELGQLGLRKALGLAAAPEIVDVGVSLKTKRPLAQEIIGGLLRRGETANIIADPKVGKSWLMYGLGLSVVTGRRWLDTFACAKGKVLLIDLELHQETCEHRLLEVMKKLDVSRHQLKGQFDLLSLRGKLPYDVHQISSLLETKRGGWDLVILDPLYRALPADTTEADHAKLTVLYNRLDAVARQLDCGWINVHHATKGSQAEKNVTDVGAGAGVQSRAVDAHLILRRHEQEDVFVFEAAVRSFPPVRPLCLRWNYPLWKADQSLDPSQLRNTKIQQQATRDEKGKAQILTSIAAGHRTARALRGELGMGADRVERLLGMLVREGHLRTHPITVNGRAALEYRPKKSSQ